MGNNRKTPMAMVPASTILLAVLTVAGCGPSTASVETAARGPLQGLINNNRHDLQDPATATEVTLVKVGKNRYTGHASYRTSHAEYQVPVEVSTDGEKIIVHIENVGLLQGR